MTEQGMNKEEKAIFLGMMAVLNIDLCAQFVCPREGCDTCPLAPVVEAHEHFIDVACRVPDKTESPHGKVGVCGSGSLGGQMIKKNNRNI